MSDKVRDVLEKLKCKEFDACCNYFKHDSIIDTTQLNAFLDENIKQALQSIRKIVSEEIRQMKFDDESYIPNSVLKRIADRIEKGGVK